MPTLVALVLLPLAVIGAQLALGLTGPWYSLYKLAMLVPPILYLRAHGLRVGRDILRLHHWPSGLVPAMWLGMAAIAIFVGAYWLWGGVLVDEDHVVERISAEFAVSRRTVLLVAPFTIIINSLLEEFFYRGFAFGLLVRKNLALGYLLPAAAFTVQHLLFISDWVGPVALTLAVVGLFGLALVLEYLYARYDTIVCPWLVHACGDVAMMGLAVQMLR
jgi:hypothetical protein